jgi:FdhE protein
LKADARALEADWKRDPSLSRRVVGWLLGDGELTPSRPGLLRYLGWSAMTRYLQPVRESFERWRDEDRWLRNYCPICGAPPAMAQLVGVDPARKRLLCCGRCRTRWRFSRTACPFCESDVQKLAVVAVEGEGGLRIDYCEACRGYLKTYAGEGDEKLLLADWTSLHLDFVARDRGLERRATSLYELEPLLRP